MTTTSTFQGLDEGSKNSSRVLRPPGGGSSDIFGTGGASAQPAAAKSQASSRKPADQGVFNKAPDAGSHAAQRTARDGSYNPITGADYKDLAPNHHALHVKEQPKPQAVQPSLPCSEGEFQAKEGKMQNVQTSTRVTNPPGGKTHKLW